MTKQQTKFKFVVANRITEMFFPKKNRLFLGKKSRITKDQAKKKGSLIGRKVNIQSKVPFYNFNEDSKTRNCLQS